MKTSFLRIAPFLAGLATSALAGAAFAAPALTAQPASRAQGAAPRTVVLVSIDGARAGLDAMPDIAPTLARLASAGARFELATTPTPLTLPATASLLSGLAPARHRLRSEALGGLDGKATMLAERLARGEFATLGLPADHLANAGTGLARGFKSYSRDAALWPDSARVDSALAFLARPGRAFVWLGLSMGQPSEVWRRYLGAGLDSTRYLGRAREVDASLARLMRGLAKGGRLDQAIVVVVGTHGLGVLDWPLAPPMFDEPGLAGHGLDLSEAAVRVPLVFSGPAVNARRGSRPLPAAWTSTLDVAPTLLEAAGLESSGCDGVSLWPVLAGRPLGARVLVHETDVDRPLGWKPRRAARMGDLKLVTFGTHPLLLRAGDSAVDRAPADGEALLVAALSDGAGASLPKPTAALAESAVRVRDAENDVALTLRRSISVPGQVQDSTTVKTLYQLSREHPENLLLNLESAIQGSLAGNDDAAAAVFLRIADHHPEFPEAVLAYADHLLWHRHAEMVPEQMLKLPAGSPLAIEGMWREVIARASELQFDIAARVLDQAPDYCTPPGRIFRDSRTSLRRLAELKDRVQANPDTASLRLAYGKTLAEYGLLEAAYQQLNQARLLDQGDPEPSLIMADYLLKQGKIEAARNAYSRAVESDRDNVRAVIGVADTWLAQDRRREALPALRRAVEVAPKDARIRYNLACVLASEGQVDDAATELERAVQLGYSDWDRITGDQDLEKVRATETYRRIVAKAPPRR